MFNLVENNKELDNGCTGRCRINFTFIQKPTETNRKTRDFIEVLKWSYLLPGQLLFLGFKLKLKEGLFTTVFILKK